MKRLSLALIAFFFAINLSACSNAADPEANNPVAAKIADLEQRITNSESNSINAAYAAFPDLSLIRSVGPDDPFSITQQSLEDWLYSKESRVTVIMWNDRNAPIHVFAGNALSQEQVQQIREQRASLLK